MSPVATENEEDDSKIFHMRSKHTFNHIKSNLIFDSSANFSLELLRSSPGIAAESQYLPLLSEEIVMLSIKDYKDE